MSRLPAALALVLAVLVPGAGAQSGSDIDLHSHSYCSDGLKNPETVVREAKAAGLKYFSLTDHDTVACLDRAVATAKEEGLGLIPGIEISAENGLVHILGLGIDPSHPALLRLSESMREDRIRWMREVLDVLKKDDVALDELEDVLLPKWNAERKADELPSLSLQEVRAMKMSVDGIIGQIHGSVTYTDLKNATVRKGYPQESLKRNMDGHGTNGPGFRESIEMIHQAGGIAILAHPYTIFKFIKKWPVHYSGKDYHDFESFAADLLAAGLDGFELHRPEWERYPEDNERMMRIVRGAGRPLLLSPGSDYHGYPSGAADRTGPPTLGNVRGYPPELQSELLRALGRR